MLTNIMQDYSCEKNGYMIIEDNRSRKNSKKITS